MMGISHTLVLAKSAGVSLLIGCCRLLVQLAGMLGCFDGGHWNSDRQTNLDWWCSLSRVTANIITRPLAAAPTARLCPLQWPVATFVSETDEQHDRRKDRYLRDQDHFSRPLCMATWAQRWGERETTRGSTADFAISACEVVNLIRVAIPAYLGWQTGQDRLLPGWSCRNTFVNKYTQSA